MTRARWSACDWLALRLRPGEDLRRALTDAFRDTGATAGFVAAQVGSLTEAHLRPAGRDAPLIIPGPLEIVSLSGTLSPDGPHLHLAVSDAGGAMAGGHLLEGCPVRTTAELVLGLATGIAFRREHDPATGHAELRLGPD